MRTVSLTRLIWGTKKHELERSVLVRKIISSLNSELILMVCFYSLTYFSWVCSYLYCSFCSLSTPSLYWCFFISSSFLIWTDKMSNYKSIDDYLILKNVGGSSGQNSNSNGRSKGMLFLFPFMHTKFSSAIMNATIFYNFWDAWRHFGWLIRFLFYSIRVILLLYWDKCFQNQLSKIFDKIVESEKKLLRAAQPGLFLSSTTMILIIST